MEIDKIYNMDCLEGMKQIPDGSVDAIICDLPYGTTDNQWDSIIPLDLLWMQYKRIIKKTELLYYLLNVHLIRCSDAVILRGSNMSGFGRKKWEQDS